jgi:anion-transporting  ArsA/GET3 family ATPase
VTGAGLFAAEGAGESPLLVVVGSGGVGKTTLAAALGIQSARRGRDTLVMTFDPSLRLKDALGVGEEAREREVAVPLPPGAGATGRLDASLLDARRTFDRLVERYAPDPESRRRILQNHFYQHLAGTLSGVLEYMAVERLFEVAREGRYGQVILDTPPTRQALDFLEAPSRIVGFLDSGALKIALRDWFDESGHLDAGWGFLSRRLEGLLDRVVGIEFLQDMLEFFQAFGPLFDGFRARARQVEELLGSEKTRFVLVAGPGEERIPDTLFFARRLREQGYRLGPLVVNRVHPAFPGEEARLDESSRSPMGCTPSGRRLFAWLGAEDRHGVEQLRALVAGSQPVVPVPLQSEEPTNLAALEALGADLLARVAAAG